MYGHGSSWFGIPSPSQSTSSSSQIPSPSISDSQLQLGSTLYGHRSSWLRMPSPSQSILGELTPLTMIFETEPTMYPNSVLKTPSQRVSFIK